MRHNLDQLYNYYLEQGGTLPEKTYKTICKEFNQAVIDDIILQGDKFKMGNHLSTLSILRIDRSYKKPTIDWAKSKRYRKELLDEGEELYNKETGEGVKWYIYYTDEHYFRFYWNKARCKVKNKTVYSFHPTGGRVGNKTKLKQLLANDDLAYLRFQHEDNKGDKQ